MPKKASVTGSRRRSNASAAIEDGYDDDAQMPIVRTDDVANTSEEYAAVGFLQWGALVREAWAAHPLLVAGGVAAVGLGLGYVLPQTRAEGSLWSGVSDGLADNIREAADAAVRKAERTMQAVTNVAQIASAAFATDTSET